MRYGQVAQSVEQGTENPRVGGSIPSLATLPSLVLFLCLTTATGCQNDHCEDLCRQTSFALKRCIDEWPITWNDLDANGRNAFQNACSTRWEQKISTLEARELEDALEQCSETRELLDEMLQDDTTCDQLRAIYIE